MTVVEAAIFGLVFGSFANAMIERIPRGMSFVKRSHCNGCGRGLGALELVPLLSYAMLRGRCRTCGDGIGVRTPAIEAMCGLAFAAAFFALEPFAAIVVCTMFVTLGIAAGAMIERKAARQ